jgi:dTDP-glucose 4,6-dehydratase
MKRLLVTGAAGFIGTNFVRRVLDVQPDWTIVAYDALTYAGNLANLDGLEATGRFEFIHADICDADAVAAAFDPARGRQQFCR